MLDLRNSFPGIWRATLEIGYDNGMINICFSESNLHDRTARVVSHCLAKGVQDLALLKKQSTWLSQLSDEDMTTVCCGEETDQQTVLVGAPPGTNDLLNAIFEHDVEDETDDPAP